MVKSRSSFKTSVGTSVFTEPELQEYERPAEAYKGAASLVAADAKKEFGLQIFDF